MKFEYVPVYHSPQHYRDVARRLREDYKNGKHEKLAAEYDALADKLTAELENKKPEKGVPTWE